VVTVAVAGEVVMAVVVRVREQVESGRRKGPRRRWWLKSGGGEHTAIVLFMDSIAFPAFVTTGHQTHNR
jgi:hypothetical protein